MLSRPILPSRRYLPPPAQAGMNDLEHRMRRERVDLRAAVMVSVRRHADNLVIYARRALLVLSPPSRPRAHAA